MSRFVAFLRAINVGGHKIIKMDDLKKIFQSFGLENVQSFIQSGNIIFESQETNTNSLEKKLENQLEQALGYKVELFLRTVKEVADLANKSPFKPKEGETVHIVFLNEKPDKTMKQALMAFRSEADDFVLKGREVYNLRRDRNKSIFSNMFMEKTLRVPATSRNLTTIQKITKKYG